MNRGLIRLLLVLTAFGVQARAQATNPGATELLPAPVQVFPGDNARLPDSQTITFTWSKVPGAARYGIQIDSYAWGWTTDRGQPGFIALVDGPAFTFNTRGPRLGSWRVWAIDNKWQPGEVSEWLVYSVNSSELILVPPPSNGAFPAGFPERSRTLAANQRTGPLPAPQHLSPADGARLQGYPRTMTFKWAEVPGASRYGIEIDYYGGSWNTEVGRPGYVTSVKEPAFTHNFVGNQPGSWRVWAIDKRSRPGEPSPWLLFSYAPANHAMPAPPASTDLSTVYLPTPKPPASVPAGVAITWDKAAPSSSPPPPTPAPENAASSPQPPATVAKTEAQSPASDAAPQPPKETLPAPQQLSVANTGRLQKAALEGLSFQWSTVSGAIAYGVEIDCYGCCAEKRWCSATNYRTEIEWMVRTNPYSYSFPSGRPGSWRVWAIDIAGRSGKVSPWSVFSFAAVDPKTSLPSPPETTAAPRALPFPIVMQSQRPVDPTTGEACTWPATNPSGPGITVPRGLYTPDPDYGDSSRRWGINGEVTMIAEIGADGRVKRACVLDAVQPDLGEQAVKAIKLWRFEPARKNGEAIPYALSVETNFNLFPWPNR